MSLTSFYDWSKKELSFLENGLNSRGTLRVAFVSGMRGIGKSYLFEELAKRLANQNPHHLLVVINGGEVKTFIPCFQPWLAT